MTALFEGTKELIKYILIFAAIVAVIKYLKLYIPVAFLFIVEIFFPHWLPETTVFIIAGVLAVLSLLWQWYNHKKIREIEKEEAQRAAEQQAVNKLLLEKLIKEKLETQTDKQEE